MENSTNFKNSIKFTKNIMENSTNFKNSIKFT